MKLSFQAIKEKELGNAAYKKKDFETAIKHYDDAFNLDPTNITILTNKGGKFGLNFRIFIVSFQLRFH